MDVGGKLLWLTHFCIFRRLIVLLLSTLVACVFILFLLMGRCRYEATCSENFLWNFDIAPKFFNSIVTDYLVKLFIAATLSNRDLILSNCRNVLENVVRSYRILCLYLQYSCSLGVPGIRKCLRWSKANTVYLCMEKRNSISPRLH